MNRPSRANPTTATASAAARRPLLVAVLVVAIAAVGDARLAAAADGPVVGVTAVRYEDPARRAWTDDGARPIRGFVWYPAASGSAASDWEIAIFEAGRVARDAPLASAPERLPLVVLSHGTGGSAIGLAWFAAALAREGYLVAAPNHHGNTAAEDTQPLEGTVVLWDRPRDLSVLIDRLLADPHWGPRIDATRIGVAGFSAGGYAALAAVGARLDRAQWLENCRVFPSDCELPPEARERYAPADVERLLATPAMAATLARLGDDLRDDRIAAAYVMAPVGGPAMTRASLAAIRVPVRIVVGTVDDQAVPERNAVAIGQVVPGAEVELLPGVTHYTFLPTCTARGRNFVGALCASPPGVDRDAVHRRVAADAVAFFGKRLAAP